MIVVMHVTSEAAVWVESVGENECRLMVEQGNNVLNLSMSDAVLRQIVAAANAHLDCRAAEKILAMMAAERERRRRAKEKAAEATAADALVG